MGSLVRETFDGQVKIEETEGGGTTFIIDLPTSTAQSRTQPAVIREHGEWWKKITTGPA